MLATASVALLTYNEKDNCCFAARTRCRSCSRPPGPSIKLFGTGRRVCATTSTTIPARTTSSATTASSTKSSASTGLKAARAIRRSKSTPARAWRRICRGQPRPPNWPGPGHGEVADANSRSCSPQRRPPTSGKIDPGKPDESYVGPTHISRWRLRIDNQLTVPAVEFVTPKSDDTTIVLADAGKKATTERIAVLLAAGEHVVAVDPFFFGESKIEKRDFLFALLVSSVGERPLGVQARQLQQIARHLKAGRPKSRVSVLAIGPRTSLIALGCCRQRLCGDRRRDAARLAGLSEGSDRARGSGGQDSRAILLRTPGHGRHRHGRTGRPAKYDLLNRRTAQQISPQGDLRAARQTIRPTRA